jgi:predicted regulator of Ras-like GTPase activity (Roadblock/LC7/MglB family)
MVVQVLQARSKTMRQPSGANGAPIFNAAQLRPFCEQEVARLCENYPEVSLALVATADARLVTSRSSRVQHGDRAAAMVGSLLALCESLSKELSGGACQSVVVTMDEYTSVIVHVTGIHQSLVLAIGVGENVMLALARRVALDLARRLSIHLKTFEVRHRHAPPPP